VLGGSLGDECEDLEVRTVKKWVILSCTPSNIYDFFLPIAVRIWRKRIGYEPVVVLVGSKEDWRSGHSKVVYDEIAGKERIEFLAQIPGLPDSAVSMGLRQNVSALDFDQDDVLLIGDVDLFPVDRDFYHRYDHSKNPVGVYYSEMYEHLGDDQYWPAYGVSMPVRNWREVMEVTAGDFRGSVERTFTKENLKNVGMWDGTEVWDTRFWTFDEKYATFKIKNSRFAKDVATFPSFVGSKRPYRFKLPHQPYACDYVDFHCSRPGWNEENWPDIRYALAQMIPEDLRWIDRYVSAYRRSLGRDLGERPESLDATPLPWDSEVFGARVGLLKPEGSIPRSLSIVEANRGRFDVVFVKAQGRHEPKGVAALDYTYEMEFSGPVDGGDASVVELHSPNPAHLSISSGAFPDSRFNRDPKISRKTGEFYEKWLSGDGVIYVLNQLVDDAFVIVSVDPDGAGRISLVAVFEKSRGLSIGGNLVLGAMRRRRDLKLWRVRVNARNIGAIRFYERLGFRVKSVQTAFHVWMEDHT